MKPNSSNASRKGKVRKSAPPVNESFVVRVKNDSYVNNNRCSKLVVEVVSDVAAVNKTDGSHGKLETVSEVTRTDGTHAQLETVSAVTRTDGIHAQLETVSAVTNTDGTYAQLETVSAVNKTGGTHAQLENVSAVTMKGMHREVSATSADKHSSTSKPWQQMMHIIIDHLEDRKLSPNNVTAAVLQAGSCSLVYSPEPKPAASISFPSTSAASVSSQITSTASVLSSSTATAFVSSEAKSVSCQAVSVASGSSPATDVSISPPDTATTSSPAVTSGCTSTSVTVETSVNPSCNTALACQHFMSTDSSAVHVSQTQIRVEKADDASANGEDNITSPDICTPFRRPSWASGSNVNNTDLATINHSPHSKLSEQSNKADSGSLENLCMGNPNSATGDETRLLSKAKEEEPDFLFILLTSQVKGKSVSYSKQSFKCFHCHYVTSLRRSMVTHMVDSHSDHLAIHRCIDVLKVENPDNLSQKQLVIKMSDFNAVLSKQRKQAGKKRVFGVEKQDLPGCFPCSECDKVFGRLRYLRKHKAVHKTDQKHLCPECGKAFKIKAYLTAHRQTHQSKTVYQCSQCDFSSSINSLIHAHRQLHNGSSIICDICGHAYNDRHTLKKHQQVHDESRPFACSFPECTWRFKTQVMCRAHYRSHTTTGKFVCQLCSYNFRHKHHLQRHLSKIHGMDDASIYHATCGSSKHPVVQVESYRVVQEVVADGQGKQLVEVINEESQTLTDGVSLIVNSGLSSEQLQSVLESGQFVVATDDSEVTGGNYEVANITMTTSYSQGLASGPSIVSDGHTILIPPDAECSEIIFYQEAEVESATVM